MSALAAEHGAVNLGQGFPDFDCDPALLDAVNAAMRDGLNQYPPMAGVPPLREAVADKIEALYGRRYDPDTEITVTAGATQAILTAILCCRAPGRRGDRARALLRQLRAQHRAGRRQVVRVPLTPRHLPARLRRHRRGDHAAHARDHRQLAAQPERHRLDGAPTCSAWPSCCADRHPADLPTRSTSTWSSTARRTTARASIPELAARSFVVSSFGKTYHVTGWKVGYVAAPAPLMAEFRKVHQFNVFTVNTPMQHGLAAHMADAAAYLELPAFYQRKRDLFRAGLEDTRFGCCPAGSYFQCVDYSASSATGSRLLRNG